MSQSSKKGSKRAKAENGDAKVVEVDDKTKADDTSADDEAKGSKRATKAAARNGKGKGKGKKGSNKSDDESKKGSQKGSGKGSKKGSKKAAKEPSTPTRRSGRNAGEEAPTLALQDKPKPVRKSKAKSKAKAKKDDKEDAKEEASDVDTKEDGEAKKDDAAPAKKAKAKSKSKAKSKAKAKSKKGSKKGSKKASKKDDEKEEKVDRDAERQEEMANFPTIELEHYLSGDDKKSKAQAKKDCKEIAKLLHQYGFLIVKDPRVTMSHNDTFIDTLENYYGQSDDKKAPDIRKELHYQVGITPEKVEKARNHCSKVEKLDSDEKPLTLCPPEVDKKLRFFWRIGKIPEKTEFKQLNADPVLPADFPEWPKVMNTWGELILQTVNTVAEMAAEGFGLPKESFTEKMNEAPHLLAPTGSDFNKYGDYGNILASYHYDLNFLTIHGRSRFPGLFIWTRDGKKLMVKVPPGCLLLQAGKQFEWLTGGHVLAGFHEVVVVKETQAAIAKAREEKKSLWRVSSTLFGHIASDQILEPLGKFAKGKNKAETAEIATKYPPTKAGNQVQLELNAIKLGQVAAGDSDELVAAM